MNLLIYYGKTKMTHITLSKTPTGWANADPTTEELHRKTKLGQTIHGDFKKMRNSAFHRKMFSLLNLGFEYFTPSDKVDSKHGIPEKNFDRFRRDVIILAGYYHTTVRLDNTIRVEADSISFASMDEDTFSKLYQAVLTVLIERIPMLKKMGEDEINKLTDQFLEFA